MVSVHLLLKLVSNAGSAGTVSSSGFERPGPIRRIGGVQRSGSNWPSRGHGQRPHVADLLSRRAQRLLQGGVGCNAIAVGAPLGWGALAVAVAAVVVGRHGKARLLQGSQFGSAESERNVSDHQHHTNQDAATRIGGPTKLTSF